NREMYAAATTRGAISGNVLPGAKDGSGHLVPYVNIHNLLDTAHVDWKFYSAGATPQLASLFVTSPKLSQTDGPKLLALKDFFADAKAGTLPSVAWVDEAFRDPNGTGSNEHPSANM